MSYATATHDDITVESSGGETAEQMRHALSGPSDPPPALTADLEPDAPAVDEPEPDAGKKAKPRDNPQARFSQLTQQRDQIAAERDAERARAAQLEARLKELEAQRAAPPKDAKETPAPKAGKPTEDEIGTTYANYGEYLEALTDWKLEQKASGQKDAPSIEQLVQQEIDRREVMRRVQEVGAAHAARVDTFRADHADYDAVVEAGNAALNEARTGFGPAMNAALIESPHGPALIYWLGSHPTELIQLANQTAHLDAAAAPLVRELLETRAGAGARSGSAPSAQASAKPPIRPVGASPVTAPPDDDPDGEPFDSYFKRANARDRKEGRR